MSSNPENTDPPTDSTHHKTPSSDLFSSAQVLVGAAQSAWSHDGTAVDKTKVAQAGEELLDAGAEYGKLRERGYGSYLDKAEGYLHQFHPSNDKKQPTDEHPSLPHEQKSTDAVEESTPEETKSAGGFGDYLNIAQGFFKK